MVYQGPSRGCNSCKLRRKKCDETRPSCMRCIRANRACGGYEYGTDSAFRQYKAQNGNPSSEFVSRARKCGMPMRVPIPGTDVLPKDTIPIEVSQAESNELCLRAFFYDYCIISTNTNLSRGFLSSLEMMVCRLGSKSDLAKACRAVSFGSHGKPLHRPQLVHKAERFYQELLGSLASAIENPASANAAESKLVAMLLGLYEMTTATVTDHGAHDAHAKGLAALMQIGHLPLRPLNLLGTVRSGHRSSPNKNVLGVFSAPALSDQGESLDDLLLSLDMVWVKSEASCESQNLNALKNESIALDRRFANWERSRVPEFKPTIIGYVSKSPKEPEIVAGYWPGKVETYFDLYVAGVWNIFRTARLLLAALIIKLSGAIMDNVSRVDYINTSNYIVEDIISSIPYHLVDNLQDFVGELATNREISNPGKSLGGLLLIHPLYVTSSMSFLPDNTREYMRRCLEWIGLSMGLGQATLLAKTPDIDRDYLASGCMIIWSGFLG